MADNTVDDSLHVPSLRVEGFRGIDSLTINRLGRVTLLAGRNGTGKTTVLDAVRIFADRGYSASLAEVLRQNEEFDISSHGDDGSQALLDFSALFHGRASAEGAMFRVGAVDANGPMLSVSIVTADDVPRERRDKRWDLASARTGQVLSVSFGDFDGYASPSPMDMPARSRRVTRRGMTQDRWPDPIKCLSLGPEPLPSPRLDELWGEIALTPDEEAAVESMRLAVHSEIDGVALVPGADRSHRLFLVRLNGHRVPLPSLGDGAVRLFGVAVALAGSAGGLLLIDEAENGIHHSLQHDFWRLVLRAAADSNIQVIATTHGWDCIRGFASASGENDDVEGVVVRLERDGGGLRAVEYSEEELETATAQGIEVR